MQQVDGVQYLETISLVESTVLRLSYSQREGVFDLVIDYAAEAVSQWFEHQQKGLDVQEYNRPPRDFRWLSFRGVSRIAYKGRDWDGSEEDWRRHPIVLARPAERRFLLTVAAADLARTQLGQYRLDVEMSAVLEPRYCVTFGELFAQRRLGTYVSGDRYQDVQSAESFSCYEPFAEAAS